MVFPNDTTETGDEQPSPTRRKIIQSIGAAGAAAAGAAAAGTAAADDDVVGDLAEAHATENHAREAFDSELGRKLLRTLSEHGYLESATFDALGVSEVTAARSFSVGQLTVTQGRHENAGEVVGFITGIETDEFDGPLTVRLYPEAGIAGATAERDGEAVVISPKYDGIRSRSEIEPQACNTCAGYESSCNSHSCDCGRSCYDHDDMCGKYTAHTVCDDGWVYCDDCSLCCDTGCYPWDC